MASVVENNGPILRWHSDASNGAGPVGQAPQQPKRIADAHLKRGEDLDFAAEEKLVEAPRQDIVQAIAVRRGISCSMPSWPTVPNEAPRGKIGRVGYGLSHLGHKLFYVSAACCLIPFAIVAPCLQGNGCGVGGKSTLETAWQLIPIIPVGIVGVVVGKALNTLGNSLVS